VRMEILRIQNAGYQFSGLLALCAVPFFLIPLIRSWAVSIEPGMLEFYDGSYGMGTTLVCYVGSAAGLVFILWLHYPDLKPVRQYRMEQRLLRVRPVRFCVDWQISRRYSRYLKKNEELKKLQGFGNIRQFLVRKCLCGLFGGALLLAALALVKQTGRIQLGQEFSVPSVWTVELSEEEKQQMTRLLREEFAQMMEENAAFAELDSKDWAGYSAQIQEACTELLEKQKEAYDAIHFTWYDGLFFLCAVFVGTLLPELALALCRWNVEQKKMEETLRFETMILALMNYPEITVEDILSWLESFAELFRRALERAVDSFSYNRQQALSQLREDAGYEPVGRIADALAGCDEVRIQDAFLNMEAERNYYMDQYRQKINAWTGERAAIARVTAYVPFVMVLAFKLVIPFVAQGLSQMSMYSDGMNMLM